MRSIQEGSPHIVCHLELTSVADPELPVRPGDTVDFELRLTPEGDGSRYYGYLMVESFERVATIEGVAGMSLLPSGDRYATSTDAGVERLAKFTLRVHDNVRPDAFFIPQLRAGIIAHGGSSLTSTTLSLKDMGYRIAPLPPQGRRLDVMPGYRGMVKNLAEGLPAGAGLVGVGPARHGATSAEPDGTVVYSPFQGYAGYDWFSYVLDDGSGRLVKGQVTVFVGDLGRTPGVMAG
ncbi:Ig-like domain-containing protein [Streptomyces sp. NPDC006274]|uniref:Ig-like domain-containing protein n=1 Tax=unclassified Streptomyces TaxID=2593676 RepID=UPI0033BAB60E